MKNICDEVAVVVEDKGTVTNLKLQLSKMDVEIGQ